MPASTTPDYLQKKLAGTVDLVVLEDSYHMVTVDRQRHVVVERTTAFVGRVASALKAGARSCQDGAHRAARRDGFQPLGRLRATAGSVPWSMQLKKIFPGRG